MEPPQTTDQFFERLRVAGEGMPKRLRQCAEYVAAYPERIAVSTVAELADLANVQPSAFMRFCQELGFSGYSQLQRLFREDYTQRWPDYATRLANLRAQADNSPSALLGEFAEAGRMSLENLMRTVRPGDLDAVVDVLSQAETIQIVGYRRAFPVASYLYYAFEKMGIPAILHSGLGHLSSRQMYTERDAMIAITFAPYSSETVELARVADAAGVRIVAMTDLITSPLLKLHATPLFVSEIDVDDFRTLTATLTLAMAMAVSVGARRGPA